MPIEIREIIIRATVGEQLGGGKGTGGGAEKAGQEDIVKECVEQVLEILREKGER